MSVRSFAKAAFSRPLSIRKTTSSPLSALIACTVRKAGLPAPIPMMDSFRMFARFHRCHRDEARRTCRKRSARTSARERASRERPADLRRPAPFGQSAEEQTDYGPQHRVNPKRRYSETPQHDGGELLRYFIDRGQAVLRDGDDHDEGRAGQDRRVPYPESRAQTVR